MNPHQEQLLTPFLNEEFPHIVNTFVSDLTTAFPEYGPLVAKWWHRPNRCADEDPLKEAKFVFRHCMNVYPQRFQDVLNRNSAIFAEDSLVRTDFLPGIVFKELWNLEDLSEQTRDSLWRHLQLMMVSLFPFMPNTDSKEEETTGIDAFLGHMNENKWKNNVQGLMHSLQSFLDQQPQQQQPAQHPAQHEEPLKQESQKQEPQKQEQADQSCEPTDALAELMSGPLGKFALEMAEETASELNLTEAPKSMGEVFQKMFQQPGKLMTMVQSIQSRLQEKVSSGELNQAEMMRDATAMMNKMHAMPGLPQEMQQMMANMQQQHQQQQHQQQQGLSSGNGAGPRFSQTSKLRERLRAKAEASALQRALLTQQAFSSMPVSSAPSASATSLAATSLAATSLAATSLACENGSSKNKHKHKKH